MRESAANGGNMKVFRYALAFVLAFSVSAAFGQSSKEKKPTGGKPESNEPSAGTMTKNMAELERFSKMVLGTWHVEESHEASDMGPAGKSSGTAVFRKGPGGMSVIENMNMAGTDGKFDGMGIFWWDPKDQSYRGVWCDSMTPTCDPNTVARWEGDKLVANTWFEMPDGKKMYMRDEYTDITPNSMTFTVSSGTDQNSLKPMMTLKYTRKGGPPAASKPDTKK